MMTITNIHAWRWRADPGREGHRRAGWLHGHDGRQGQVRVKVPYGWTGSLTFFKEDLDIRRERQLRECDRRHRREGPEAAGDDATASDDDNAAAGDDDQTTSGHDNRTTQAADHDDAAPVRRATTDTSQPIDNDTTSGRAIPTSKEMLIQRLDQVKKAVGHRAVAAAGCGQSGQDADVAAGVQQLRSDDRGSLPETPHVLDQTDAGRTESWASDLVTGPGTPSCSAF